jgi:hypothetical protein
MQGTSQARDGTQRSVAAATQQLPCLQAVDCPVARRMTMAACSNCRWLYPALLASTLPTLKLHCMHSLCNQARLLQVLGLAP